MFSKKQRIERLKIGEILKNPKFSFSSQNFSLKTLPNNLTHPRFSVVIPKKVEKGAVKRHFLKRKLLCILKEGNYKKGFDVVLFVKNPQKEFFGDKTTNELEKLLNKCIIGE